jgi:hypothetical protein
MGCAEASSHEELNVVRFLGPALKRQKELVRNVALALNYPLLRLTHRRSRIRLSLGFTDFQYKEAALRGGKIDGFSFGTLIHSMRWSGSGAGREPRAGGTEGTSCPGAHDVGPRRISTLT